jgi:hypothetical protein
MRIMGVRSLCAVLFVGGCASHHHHNSDAGDGDATYVPDACVGLACFQFDCSTKMDPMGNPLPPTTLSGTVYAPNGTLPLYGVNVYVPQADPGPLPDGASCDQCAAGLPGDPLVATVTDENGHFELKDVPATSDVPVVIQIGKWRRQLEIPAVAACTVMPLDAVDTSLPKSRDDMTPLTTKVDMPRIAVSTGNADAIECLILKLGIDPKEIGASTRDTMIHLYTDPGNGRGASTFRANWPGGTDPMTDSRTFWADVNNLKKYDIVMLSCEGSQGPAGKPQSALQAMHDYADAGGRVFASHWHNIWIGGEVGKPSHGMADWESVATWSFAGNPNPDTLTAMIDQVNNPKGVSFASWMQNVGGSTTLGQLTVAQSRNTCSAVDPMKAEQWVYLDPATADPPGTITSKSAMNFQFTTPQNVAADQRCGKVVFSDMHVSADSGSTPGTPYPNSCSTQPLTGQEKALAFMFFDIASCVGSIF